MRFCWILCWLAPFLYSSEGEEEALFLRRIADFWEEGEFQIAKSQIEQFIAEYPESPFSDPLCGALGDLFLREKNYSQALHYYAQVQSPEFIEKVFLNRMQCLYEMQWYATLADECEKRLASGPDLSASYFLAISLYQQCLNGPKEADPLQKIAERAKPYFEILLQNHGSNELAQGYAHICCILKEYGTAAEIYLSLAEKDPSIEEEMLFQLALVQTEYDPHLALKTFERIEKLGGKKGKEAAYNWMVLSFDSGRYQELIEGDLLNRIPSEKIGAGRLLLGRSFVHLKKYERGIEELKNYLEETPISESFYAALVTLLEASYESGDLNSLDEGIEKLSLSDPNHPQLPKAFFCRAQILKRKELFPEAKKELEKLLVRFPSSFEKKQAAFQLAQIEYELKNWDLCYERSHQFLTDFEPGDLLLSAWRYLVSSSLEIGSKNRGHLSQLAEDIEMFLTLDLEGEEQKEWELLLAKTHYDLGRFDQAKAIVENLSNPNGKLLLSLCYRDGENDLERFCQISEEALQTGADWIDPSQIHLFLYNAYLEQGEIEKGAAHLYEAFIAGSDLKGENLIWLADFYFTQLIENEKNETFGKRASILLEHCKTGLQLESASWKLAKVYSILGKSKEAIALLTSLEHQNDEALLLLAENYVREGSTQSALSLFDRVIGSAGTGRSPIGASALLQRARIKRGEANPNEVEIASELKNIVLQKNLQGEPLYLEAGLDYVDLLAKNDPVKRSSLLLKMKADFETKEDLLSKDYHAARENSVQKNRIYQGYMKLIEAELLQAQAEIDRENGKELQAKAKDILLQIMNDPLVSALEKRANKLLPDQ